MLAAKFRTPFPLKPSTQGVDVQNLAGIDSAVRPTDLCLREKNTFPCGFLNFTIQYKLYVDNIAPWYRERIGDAAWRETCYVLETARERHS